MATLGKGSARQLEQTQQRIGKSKKGRREVSGESGFEGEFFLLLGKPVNLERVCARERTIEALRERKGGWQDRVSEGREGGGGLGGGHSKGSGLGLRTSNSL